MSEVREKLKPLLGKRIKVRGSLVNFGEWTRNYRDVGRACISCPEHNGDVIAEHVWVTDVPHWLKFRCSLGEQVEFTAVVKSYADRDGTTNYCLTNADELVLLHCAPALAIPDSLVEDMFQPEPNDDPPPAGEDNQEPLTDPLEMMRNVKRFARECGGLEPAERIAVALQGMSIPIAELVRWLHALKEE